MDHLAARPDHQRPGDQHEADRGAHRVVRVLADLIEQAALLRQRARVADLEPPDHSRPQQQVRSDRDRGVQAQRGFLRLGVGVNRAADEPEREHDDRSGPMQCDRDPAVTRPCVRRPHAGVDDTWSFCAEKRGFLKAGASAIGTVSRNHASLKFNSFRPLRASAGDSRAVIGIAPKTLPRIRRSLAAALEPLDFHELGVVGGVERDHARAPTFSKSILRSSHARTAAARPAPNTPPPGCWNGPTR